MIFSSERLNLIEFNSKMLNDKILNWFQNPELMRYYTNSKTVITKQRLLESIEARKN
jgi:hypothetical protein